MTDVGHRTKRSLTKGDTNRWNKYLVLPCFAMDWGMQGCPNLSGGVPCEIDLPNFTVGIACAKLVVNHQSRLKYQICQVMKTKDPKRLSQSPSLSFPSPKPVINFQTFSYPSRSRAVQCSKDVWRLALLSAGALGALVLDGSVTCCSKCMVWKGHIWDKNGTVQYTVSRNTVDIVIGLA